MAEQEAELPTRPRMHGRAGSGASDQAPDAWPSRKRSFRPGPGCMAEQEAELPTRPRMHGRAGSGASDQAQRPERLRPERPSAFPHSQNHATLKSIVKKNLTQGITDFKKFIDNDCYFVDKTRLIAHLINDPSEVHLITRPPPLRQNPESQHDPLLLRGPRHRAAIIAIHHLMRLCSTACPYQNIPMPRIHGEIPCDTLKFQGREKIDISKLHGSYQDMLSAEYQRHEYLQNCGVLRDAEKELFSKILDKKGSDQDCEESITFLSIWLKRAYGKPVYILLDEYDTPLHAAYTDSFYDEMIAFIRNFMVQSFKDNPNLKQAVVIGILKVAQESIFSDFNNPAVSTLLDPEMEDCFGFTEPEVGAMADYYGLGTRWTASGNGTTATSSARTRSSTTPGA